MTSAPAVSVTHRVLLDANIFISYLLDPTRQSPISAVVEGVLEERFTLLLPQELVDEFASNIEIKPYLSQRITAAELHEFILILSYFADIRPYIDAPLPRITRELKDDYLLAHALFGQADFLVSGDKDLLVLERVDDLWIVSPTQFADLLNTPKEL